MILVTLVLAQQNRVSFRPDASALPGSGKLASLVNGLGFWALLACLAAVLLGAAFWAIGSRSSNYGAVGNGKSMVFGGALGAALIGASAALVNFFFTAGSGI
ncbi:MAG: DUF6112 family protein [Actinomycetota bacterium]|jgi:hypothetical protein|nr:hypothetical protein [Euzebyales bacterium]MDQ3529773.1 DUF6112 family protein [Actinomycetota bacterium]